jgi:hypothetical protein
MTAHGTTTHPAAAAALMRPAVSPPAAPADAPTAAKAAA